MTGRHCSPRSRRVPGPALAGYAARTVPWGPVLAGCLAGTCVALALRVFAGPTESPAVLTAGLRLSFGAVLAGLAFVPHDPQRQLTCALPARSWRLALLRAGLVAPLAAAAGAGELLLAGRALAVDLRAGQGGTAAPLAWQALAVELAAWCLLALALATGLERTRWQDAAGPAAVVVTAAVVGAAGWRPLHLLPAMIPQMTALQHRHWEFTWQAWAATAVVAGAAANWTAGDSWHRLWRLRLRRAAPHRGGAFAPPEAITPQ